MQKTILIKSYMSNLVFVTGWKRGAHTAKSDHEGEESVSDSPALEVKREKSPEPSGSPHHSSNGDKVRP